MRLSVTDSYIAEGLPSVIMNICLFAFFFCLSICRASSSPAFVFVWNGPTLTNGSSETETSRASSPNKTILSESLRYLDNMSSERASATCLAGVILSSPYNIMLWLISTSSTVDTLDMCSVSLTSISSSLSEKSSNPARKNTLDKV